MLNTGDPSDDPEESWSHIEHEMQRLLTTVEKLQEPNKIVDIERKLLGAVLKEENIDRIEQIRAEYRGIEDNITDVQESNREQTETGTKHKPNMDVNKLNQTREGDCIQTVEIGEKECFEKEIQVNTGQIELLKQELSEEFQVNVNNELYYADASTQTRKYKNIKEFESKNKQQTNKKQCCEENKKVNKIEVKEQATKIKRENTNTNNLDSIEVNINRKVNEVSNELKGTENRILTPTTTNTHKQIQQILSNISVGKEIFLDTDCRIQESQNIKPITTITTLPRIKFQPKRQNNNRITNAIRDISKSGTVFKINVKPEEWSRQQVYMHLPIATTRNRGLGLIPPINKRMIITPATDRQHIFPTDINRVSTVPIEMQLHTTARKQSEFKLEVLNKDALLDYGLKLGRVRALTII